MARERSIAASRTVHKKSKTKIRTSTRLQSRSLYLRTTSERRLVEVTLFIRRASRLRQIGRVCHCAHIFSRTRRRCSDGQSIDKGKGDPARLFSATASSSPFSVLVSASGSKRQRRTGQELQQSQLGPANAEKDPRQDGDEKDGEGVYRRRRGRSARRPSSARPARNRRRTQS